MDRLSTTLGMVHTTLDWAAVLATLLSVSVCLDTPGRRCQCCIKTWMALNYDTLRFKMEAELHLMDMVDRDKVSVVEGLRMYI